jgi:AAA domain/Bifunctional DNA primase/polymerase, N-terminal
VARDDRTADTVRDYLDRGWAVVPVDARDKSPNIHGWPELAAQRAFTPHDFEGRNVGVVLGPVSGDLVDIDLDSAAALQLAPYFLPETRTFGRRSKRASHWLFKAPGARFDQLKFGPKERRELVEIRAQNADGGCGHQSVFPGSTHESGERVEWDNDDAIAEVDAGDLAWRVARLAVACVVLDGWHVGGGRNVKSLGVTGGLLKMGWRADEVRDLMRAVRECSGLDREDDARAVDNTIKNYEKDPNGVTGFGALLEDGDLEPHALQSIRRHARTPTTRALEAGLLSSRLGRHAQAEHLHDERDASGMLERVDNPHRIARNAAPPSDEDLLSLGRLVSLAVPPKPIQYMCKGLQLAPGKISAVSGYGGMGKGPLLMYMLLCFASGQPIFGHPVERQRCMHFDFETGDMTRWRFERFARWLGLDLAALEADSWISFVEATGKKIDGQWLDDLDLVVSKASIGVVGIDSYSSAVAGDQNESTYADVAWALGHVSHTRKTLMLSVVHENKGAGGKRADDDLKMIAGNGHLAFAMQSVISVVRPDPKVSKRYEVRSARGPEGGFAPFTVEWFDVPAPEELSTGELIARGEDPTKWGLEVRRVEGAEPPTAVAGRQQDELLRIAGDVVRYLDGRPAGGASLTRIRSIVSGSNTTIKNVVASLASDGVLVRLVDDTYELATPNRDNAEARLRWGVASSGRRGKNAR